jgi:transposase InsO family protein
VLLRRKSDAFGAFKLFKALAENQLGRNIKALHDDKGGEYMSKEFNNFCDESGILRTHTTRNRPQQNGDAERANRTMLEDVTAMLSQAKLPVSFWGRCLATQVKVFFFFLFFF